MIKKLLFIFPLLTFSLTHAETCPTPASLQHSNFGHWQALDIDNGEPLSNSALQKFEKNVRRFSVAEWMEDAPEGEAHCYYDGLRSDYSHLGVYLAQPGLTIDKNSPLWQRIDAYVVQCTLSISQCFFTDK